MSFVLLLKKSRVVATTGMMEEKIPELSRENMEESLDHILAANDDPPKRPREQIETAPKCFPAIGIILPPVHAAMKLEVLLT